MKPPLRVIFKGLAQTDIAQAILDAVESHEAFEMPIWLRRVYDELKKQQKEREGD